MDALAPEWMKSKEMPSSQGKSMLGRERGPPPPKYGKQHSYHHFTYLPSSSNDHPSAERKPPSTPFSCSVASSPSPSSPNGEVNPSRVLNRSKSSPGFGSPKSAKPKLKSPDRSSGFTERSFPSFGSHPKPPLKPKPVKPSFFPSYGKSQSQPNLFNSEKTAHWHQQKFQNSPMQPPSSLPPSHLSHPSHSTHSSHSSHTSHPSHLSSHSSHPSHPSHPPVLTTSPPPTLPSQSPHPPQVVTVTPPPVSPSPSPPLPPSSSPPPTTVVPDELDKLRQLVPSAVMPPKSVRPRALVGPPPPLTKKTREASNTISSPSPSSPLASLASSLSVAQQPGSPSASPAGAQLNLASYFRKATSEPTLMHHKAQMDARRAKALEEKEKEKAQRELLRETANGPKQKRSNFFQHVIKQEGQPKSVEDDSPIGQDQHPGSPAPESDCSEPSPSSTTSTPLPSSPPPALLSPPLGMRSPLPEDVEDEERFLRTMGWVPESEEIVPVLEEEEMAAVKVKISLSKKKDGDEDEEEEEEEVEEERSVRFAPLSPPVGVGVE